MIIIMLIIDNNDDVHIRIVINYINILIVMMCIIVNKDVQRTKSNDIDIVRTAIHILVTIMILI